LYPSLEHIARPDRPDTRLIDMQIKSRGDLHIDDHHTVEGRFGIHLAGMAFAKAIGDKKGIRLLRHCLRFAG